MGTEKLVKKNIRKLKPYEAKEITCRVKLDANESPYGFTDALKSILKIETNRYPDPEATELRATLAKSWGVGISNILHGNGSDELIYCLINTFGGPVMYPSPTFSMYGIIAKTLNEKAFSVSLGKNFELDAEKMRKGLKAEKPRLLFLSSPNNPTGNSFDRRDIEKLIKESKGIVVVDEAYQPFSPRESFMKSVRRHPNLVVLRTLSKVGLASLRSGFVVGRKEIIDEVNKVRLPFNVNSLSQAVAVSALKNKKGMNDSIKTIVRERNILFEKLRGIRGIKVFESDANFILFKVKSADSIYKGLLSRGVLVRNLSDVIKGCLRVTVGRPEENNVFIKELTEIVSKM